MKNNMLWASLALVLVGCATTNVAKSKSTSTTSSTAETKSDEPKVVKNPTETTPTFDTPEQPKDKWQTVKNGEWEFEIPSSFSKLNDDDLKAFDGGYVDTENQMMLLFGKESTQGLTIDKYMENFSKGFEDKGALVVGTRTLSKKEVPPGATEGTLSVFVLPQQSLVVAHNALLKVGKSGVAYNFECASSLSMAEDNSVICAKIISSIKLH